MWLIRVGTAGRAPAGRQALIGHGSTPLGGSDWPALAGVGADALTVSTPLCHWRGSLDLTFGLGAQCDSLVVHLCVTDEQPLCRLTRNCAGSRFLYSSASDGITHAVRTSFQVPAHQALPRRRTSRWPR